MRVTADVVSAFVEARLLACASATGTTLLNSLSVWAFNGGNWKRASGPYHLIEATLRRFFERFNENFGRDFHRRRT